MPEIIYPELSYQLTGLFFQVQKNLGRFCREKQYSDCLEELLEKSDLKYKREFELQNLNQESPKGNRADFLIEDRVVVEIKAKSYIKKIDYYQIQRYLRGVNFKLGLIVNFRNEHLKAKRVINKEYVGEYQAKYF